MPETSIKAELLYDATCRFCTAGVGRLRPWLSTRNIATVPFKNGATEPEMKLICHDGRTFDGAEAAIFLARQFWFTLPFALVAMLPGVRQLVHAVYRVVAENRSCLNGVCQIEHNEKRERNPIVDWSILTALIVIAAVAGLAFKVPAWLSMWLLAGALWLGFKFMAFRSEGGVKEVNPLFFAWIGCDAVAFRWHSTNETPTASRAGREYAQAAGFIVAGFVIVLGILPSLTVTNTLAVGWLGVIAMLCVFHFGSFAILAGYWRFIGFPVEPIMQAPWAAKTLGDFWGPRWNRAFSDWARLHVFRPLVRRFGVAQGTIAGFIASGIAHELVISLPAHDGFGLPTLYFFIQATGLLAQRKFRLLRNRFATLTIILLPAPLLFHPAFIECVFAPMTKLIVPR